MKTSTFGAIVASAVVGWPVRWRSRRVGADGREGLLPLALWQEHEGPRGQVRRHEGGRAHRPGRVRGRGRRVDHRRRSEEVREEQGVTAEARQARAPPRPPQTSPRVSASASARSTAEAIALAPRARRLVRGASPTTISASAGRAARCSSASAASTRSRCTASGLGVAGSDPLDARLSRRAAELVDALRARLRERSPVLDRVRRSAVPRSAPDRVHGGGPFARRRARRARAGPVGRRLLLENATAYVGFRASEMAESEFFAELCARRAAAMLLDVNNLYVNAQNLGPIRARTRRCCPRARSATCTSRVTPCSPTCGSTRTRIRAAAVWELFASAVRRFPRADVILERDDDCRRCAARRRADERARARGRPAGPLAARAPAPRPTAARAPPSAASTGARSSARSSRGRHESLAHEERRSSRSPRGSPCAPRAACASTATATSSSLRDALATNFASLARVLGARRWERLAPPIWRPIRRGVTASSGSAPRSLHSSRGTRSRPTTV